MVRKTASAACAAAVEDAFGPTVKFSDRFGIDVKRTRGAVKCTTEQGVRLGRCGVAREGSTLAQVPDRLEISSISTR
jgi:hypothetical protein